MRMIADAFTKGLLQESLDPVEIEVELQKPVLPYDPQYVDVFCKPRPKRPAKRLASYLGLLWNMTRRTCSIEPCSKTPTVADLRGLLRKQLGLHYLLCHEAKNPALPMPPQWIVSPGRPQSGLAAMPATPSTGWPRGFYQSGELLGQRVIVLSELLKTPETRLLRLMGPQTMCLEAMRELLVLPEEDPARQPLIAILSKMVYLVSKKVAIVGKSSNAEHKLMTQLTQEFEQFKATLPNEGKAEGEARGEARGEAKGKAEGEARGKAEALLAVLAARGVAVSEKVRQRLLACRDLLMLDRLVVQAAIAPSPADVLAAAVKQLGPGGDY